ncbi:MAG: DUF2135 domain-containing protein [Zoogloeaceae bacterium]|jgi:uncharacterized protein YfaP (DUF2135 family)|nr:DUF2135 domain-containing protein [Zoogloeaceae bacterium]
MLKRFLPCTLVALFFPLVAQADLDLPRSGWREGNLDVPYTQTVNYPANSVSVEEGTPDVGLIRGSIRQKPKPSAKQRGKAPATLVVNGNAMPIRLDETGAFARPYSFGKGSNSIEVRAEGGETLRAQFYQTASGQAQARLRILLSWDTDGTDLDLHVITPSGKHAWYGERVIDSGAIDTDVTTGYGPEIFSSPAPERGLYQVYVNYYGRGGEDASELTTVRLTILSEEGTASEKRQEFAVPMRYAGELTLARAFVY